MKGIFLDTETNGLDPYRHTVIEIAIKVVDVTSGNELGEYATPIYVDEDMWGRSDKASLHINGFRYEMLKDAPKKESVQTDIKAFFKKHKLKRGHAVFICQNPSFDRVFFAHLISSQEQEMHAYPYHWLDLASMYWGICLKDCQRDLPWNTGFSKNNIAEIYDIPPEGIPHRAINGVNHLIACYQAVVGYKTAKDPL